MPSIGSDEPTFIIAEAGINHGGDLKAAKGLIRQAADSKADAIKFQHWYGEQFHSDPAQIERLQRLEFTQNEWLELKETADNNNIPFFASVFSTDSVDLMVDNLETPFIKVASGEITNIPLLEHVSTKQRPVILSTGMATMEEVDRALDSLTSLKAPVYLLECVSSYPAEMSDLDLRVIKTLKRAFGRSTGFSDHTTGTFATMTAVALGADIIEKHFMLDNNHDGPDQELSLTPKEFEAMVNQIRAVESSVGDGVKHPRKAESGSRTSMRRGLKANTSSEMGDVLTADRVKVARPSDGLEPRLLDTVVGRELQQPLDENDPITWDHMLTPGRN